MWRHTAILILFLSRAASAGGSPPPTSSAAPGDAAKETHEMVSWPEDWSPFLGQRVRIQGRAVDQKLGASLDGGVGSIWIEGLSSWPDGYFTDREGKLVEVIGVVIRQDERPLHIPSAPREEISQGLAPLTPEDASKPIWMYLLKDATWKLVPRASPATRQE